AEARAMRKARSLPSIPQALRLVKAAATEPFAAALADERATFQRLRASPEAAALRHLFFAERQAGRVEGLRRDAARKVARVGIVGGGTMGLGIARACLAAGLEVLWSEVDAAARDRAMARLEASLDRDVARG